MVGKIHQSSIRQQLNPNTGQLNLNESTTTPNRHKHVSSLKRLLNQRRNVKSNASIIQTKPISTRTHYSNPSYYTTNHHDHDTTILQLIINSIYLNFPNHHRSSPRTRQTLRSSKPPMSQRSRSLSNSMPTEIPQTRR